MKVALVVSGLVAAASATSGFNTPLNQDQHQLQQVGKVFTHEYIQPNVEQKCFSVRKVASCDDQHVASYVKHQRVGFHCIEKQSPIAKQFQRQADEGQSLPLENKTQDIQAYVEVPVRCQPIKTEEQRLRKETEKTSEQKIHLVQNGDEEESFLFEHKPWTNQLEQDQETQNQKYLIRKNKHQQKHQLNQQQNVEDSDDEDLDDLNTMEQYGDELINSMISNQKTTIHRVLKMKDDQFDRLMEHLKFIAHQNRRSDKWTQQLETILPNVFSKVAKQFFETVLEQEANTQQEKEELYEEYKQVVKRVYAYVVKQTLQMKNLKQISQSNGVHQKRYITNQVARNLWLNTQRELTSQQIEEVREIAEQVQQQKPHLDQMIKESLVAVNKEKMEQLEKDLTKVLTAGLKMVNHNIAKNQIQSEEYRKYHGEDYEDSYRTQYPKLFQRLVSINKNVNRQQWNN